MPMRLASEAQASDLKIEQKDRARFVRKVAFFATANCAWDWDPSFRSRRCVGNIGNHRDTHALSVWRNVFRRKVAEMHRVPGGLAFTLDGNTSIRRQKAR